MALKVAYQGLEVSRSSNEKIYKETFYGTYDECLAKSQSLIIGTFIENKGYFTGFSITPKEANLYSIQLQYTISYKGSNFSNTDETLVGKKSAQLSVRNIQMPLQSLDNYLAKWNHYLIGLGDVPVPSWWETAKNILIDISDRKNYMWIKSIGEIPLQPNQQGKYWKILKQPTKAGVQYYDWACFVVTQLSRYRSSSAAGNAVNKTINTISSPDNTFGLSGQWKHDEANISYDGNDWICTSVYTLAGDYKGWDKDIYK